MRELIVVDDRSGDAHRGHRPRARGAGGRGSERADWVGKPWALQQGLEAATGDVVVSLDADTRPRSGLVGALAEALDDADLVTASARFVCDGPRAAVDSAMLASARCTATGRRRTRRRARPDRRQRPGHGRAARAAAGRRRTPRPRAHMTHDAALARALAGGLAHRVRRRDRAGRRADVRVGAQTWREWGRSMALPDVTSPRVAGGRPRGRVARDGAAGHPAGRRSPARLDLALLASGWPCSGRCRAHTRGAARLLALAAGGPGRGPAHPVGAAPGADVARTGTSAARTARR